MRSVLLSAGAETGRPDLAAAAGRRAPAEAIVAYQRAIGAPEAAVRMAMRLGDPRAAAIVAGQQPGLLGGPLFTLVKALVAVARAKRLGRETGVPVVPVFWVASEDHDLDEVNRVSVLDRVDEIRTFRLPMVPDGRMLSDVDPGPAAAALLADVDGALAGSQHRGAAMAPLLACLVPSLGRWFAGILSQWAGWEGLVVVEPHLFRAAAAPLVDLVRRRPGAVRAACGPGPLEVAEVPLFRLEQGRRVRPERVGEIPDDPSRISFDVVTRVLAQNLVLPVAGHVVGPSEAAYCRQAAPAHALLGIPAPPLLPRAGVTLVEGRVERGLAAFDVDLPAVLAEGEAALARAEGGPAEFDQALAGVERALAEAYPAVRAAADRVDETLGRKAAGAEEALRQSIERLRGHARRAMERVTGRGEERKRTMLNHLRPRGARQERVLSPLPFLARHGPGLVRDLVRVLVEQPEGDLAVFLSGQDT